MNLGIWWCCRRQFTCSMMVETVFSVLAYYNVLVKPNAESKSRSVCTMLRRENDCFKETNFFSAAKSAKLCVTS